MHPDVTIYILMNDFCNRLKNLRKSAGITQQSMADGLNVHLQTVSKWERGISEPDISQLGDLARILGVTLEELLGESEGEETFSGAFDAVKLGSAISSARSAAGESQEQLSALLCVSADSVSRWERGVTCPDITCLCRLAEHFDVPVSKLYFGVQNQARPAAITVKRDSKYRRLVIVLSIALFMAVVAIILQSVLFRAICPLCPIRLLALSTRLARRRPTTTRPTTILSRSMWTGKLSPSIKLCHIRRKRPSAKAGISFTGRITTET